MQFHAGDIVDGRYRLVRLLGAGGMGEVWEAEHTTLARPVALKLVRVVGEAGGRLVHEARVLASLHHPAIVAIHDAGITDAGFGYLAMDVVVGESLATRIERGPLPVREAVRLFVDLLGGLAAAHAAGIIHRDIKPDNVLLVERPPGSVAPILIDFGIAAPLRSDGTAFDRAGTPAYMAPEQLGGLASNERTDVWACCLSLYEAITGRCPFHDEDLAITTQLVREAPLAFPTDVVDLDGRLWAILTRGLRKDPADRTPHVVDLRDALAAWLAREPPAPSPAPPSSSPSPRTREPSLFDTLIRKKLTEG